METGHSFFECILTASQTCGVQDDGQDLHQQQIYCHLQAAEASLAKGRAEAAEQHALLKEKAAEAVRREQEASARAKDLEEQVERHKARIQEGECNLEALTASQSEFMDTYAGRSCCLHPPSLSYFTFVSI